MRRFKFRPYKILVSGWRYKGQPVDSDGLHHAVLCATEKDADLLLQLLEEYLKWVEEYVKPESDETSAQQWPCVKCERLVEALRRAGTEDAIRYQLRNEWQERIDKRHNPPSLTDSFTDGFHAAVQWLRAALSDKPKIICDGCNVRGVHEHRCHGDNAHVQDEPTGRPCECEDCQ